MESQANAKEEYIFRSQFPPLPVPDDVTLPEFVLANALDNGDRVAIVDSHTARQFTYADVHRLCHRAAAGFVRLGVRPGDVVLVLLPNLPEYPVLALGIMLAGGVFSGANPVVHPDELQRHIRDAKARAVVTTSALVPKLPHRVDALSVVLVDDDDAAGNGGEEYVALSELISGDAEAELPRVRQQELCALPYSSGTTGASKGVMLSHRNLVATLTSTLFSVDAKEVEGHSTLGLMPFFHIYGLTGICCATLRAKGRIVVMKRFELPHFLDTLVRYEVDFAPVVPPILLALVKDPLAKQLDPSRLRLRSVMTAAAPLAPELLRAFRQRFPDVQVQEAYGLTEHSCITLTHCGAGEGAVRGNAKSSSVGFLLPNMELKFVDPTSGASVPRNSVGEVCVRSECVMRGYYGRDDDTRRSVDAQGWLHTGDLGYIDDDGDVFIVDRIKELIKYKGFQVPPAELEAVLLTHPSIRDAAVVPFPDENAGEIPAACVVGAEGTAITEEEVKAYVAARVAPYKKVRLVKLVAAIPKSSSGKILRRNIREELLKSPK